MKEYILPKWYLAHRNKVLQYFEITSNKIFTNKFNNYCIKIEQFENCSKGTVYKDGTIMKEIFREDKDFFYCWVQGKRNLLFFAENRQGYSIIDLDTSETLVFIDPHAREDLGFQWKIAKPNKSGTKLEVKGIVDKMPLTIIYDISEFKIPLPKLKVK